MKDQQTFEIEVTASEFMGGRAIAIWHNEGEQKLTNGSENWYKGRKPKVNQIITCPCCSKKAKVTEYNGLWD
jgi:hypothetical protein